MPEPVQLKRDLGLWGAAAIVVGTVIGSGIFIVPAEMTRNVGSLEMVTAVWIFGGLLSLAGALTYAELAAALPEAGGEYAYLREAYGPLWSFIYGWTQMWVAKSGSIAVLATGFYKYLAKFLPALNHAALVVALPIGPQGGPLEIRYGQILAMGLILFLAVENYFGVKIGGGVQVVVTLVKIGLIVWIVAIGLATEPVAPANTAPVVPIAGPVAGFFAALVAALWAYDGWNNVAMVGSEVRHPQRNLPRALVAGTLAVALLYVLANAAYFHVLSPSEVACCADEARVKAKECSDRVAGDMMKRARGPRGEALVSIAAMISMFAALNGSILSGARVPYAMARDGLFFRAVGRVNPRYHTPGVSILALSGWAMLVILSGRYENLYTYVIFASWILYAMTAAAVIVLRRKRPEMSRPYRALGYPVVPVLFVLVAAALIFSTLANSPRESLLGLVVILTGLPFYSRWKRRYSTV